MTTRKTWLKRIGVAAGAVALVATSTGAASAHNNSNGKKTGDGNGPGSSLVSEGTLTQAQASAVGDAMKAAQQSTRDAAIAGLISDGSLTQAQADLLKESMGNGMRGLASSGDFDRETLLAVREAMQANRESRDTQMATVLQTLVGQGTLTQAQADSITTAHADRPKGGPGGDGKHGGKGGDGSGARGDRSSNTSSFMRVA